MARRFFVPPSFLGQIAALKQAAMCGSERRLAWSSFVIAHTTLAAPLVTSSVHRKRSQPDLATMSVPSLVEVRERVLLTSINQIMASSRRKGSGSRRYGKARSKRQRRTRKRAHKKTPARRHPISQAIPCSRVPRTCNRRKCTIRARACRSKGGVYAIPRLYSRQQCRQMKKKGFTQRASCAPYV